VPQALKAVRKGGRVVSAGIHISDIPDFPYSLLWEGSSCRACREVKLLRRVRVMRPEVSPLVEFLARSVYAQVEGRSTCSVGGTSTATAEIARSDI
jgi:hypothetical protein